MKGFFGDIFDLSSISNVYKIPSENVYSTSVTPPSTSEKSLTDPIPPRFLSKSSLLK
jgi:hypothetical protein